jgi:hypothetical protein
MRTLNQQELTLVAGGFDPYENPVDPTIPGLFESGGDDNGNQQTDELRLDTIIITPDSDMNSSDGSGVYCEDDGGWTYVDQYGNEWGVCLDENGDPVETFIRQLWIS